MKQHIVSFLFTLIFVGFIFPQERVISTNESITQTILDLDKVSEIVGVDITSTLPKNYEVSKIGYHRSLNAEGLLSLRPSIVFADSEAGPQEVLDFIKKAGVKVFILPTPKTTEQLKMNIETIATNLNVSEKMSPLLDTINSLEKEIETNKKKYSEHSLRMRLLLSFDGMGLSQAGTESSGNALIEKLGGENMSEIKSYSGITQEGILSEQADVLIFSSSQSISKNDKDKIMQNFPLVAKSNAYQNKRFFFVQGENLLSGISIELLKEIVQISSEIARSY